MEKKKILIIKPSSLGDVINAFPAVVLIASAFPDAEIDWVINNGLQSILKFLPPVRNTIPFHRKELGRISTFLSYFWKLFKALRKEKYDMVIDLQGLLRSGLIARLAKADTVVGFDAPREKCARRFYHKKIAIPDKYTHAVERNLYLVAEALDIDYEYMDFEFPEHDDYAEAIEDIFSERGIDEKDIKIGIVPGARWPSKRWPSLFFVKLISKIIEFNYKAKFILIGDRSDREDAEYIVNKTSEKNVINCVDETNLGELVELIRRCNYVVTNDSGPMHLAAALDVPVVALFGPTDPDRCGPYSDEGAVFQPDMDCIKCYKRECKNKNGCHVKISVDEVAEYVIDKMKEVM